MIIVVGGMKGGSGKSTIATNLAAIRSCWQSEYSLLFNQEAPRDVLMVDADDQQTSTDFTTLRNERPGGAGYTCIQLAGAAVRTETIRLRDKYQDIVIDTGGRDTASQRAAMAVADLLLVPFLPRSFDVWTLEKVAGIVDEMRTVNPPLKAYAFLNRADPRGRDNAEASAYLALNDTLKFLPTPIGSRKSFANAAAAGMAITELSTPDMKAIKEFAELYRYVFDTTPVQS